jgi:battenin
VDESATPVIAYAPLPHEADDEVVDVVEEDQPQRKSSVALSLSDKWRLVRPLLTRYMLPLCEFFSIATCLPLVDC